MSCVNNWTVTFQDKTRFRYRFEDCNPWMICRGQEWYPQLLPSALLFRSPRRIYETPHLQPPRMLGMFITSDGL
jgi:hypothetical protein